jgi:adenylate kinase
MRIIFLGPPGVGKGTYASIICRQLGVPHVSTGDMVREELKKGSELGLKMKRYYDKGSLVPDKIILEILRKRFQGSDCEKGFILEGFPRTIEQANALDKITKIDMVIDLYLPDDVLVEKISARRICRKCGEIYNVVHIKKGRIDMPPLLPRKEGVCDRCGGEVYQRNDDKEEVVKERLKVYKRETKPLIDYYKKKSLLKRVDVFSGPSVMVPIIMKVMEGG